MNNSKEYVVLVHGFCRTARSMRKMEKALSAEGYEVVRVNYPSRKGRIEDFSEIHLFSIIQEKCPNPERTIHFVTHSMGGLIVRYFLSQHDLQNMGKLVMLAPPNHGSMYANMLTKIPFTQFFFGPALEQLQTGDKRFSNNLPEPHYDVGVIAGKYDEKVSIKNTQIDLMKDFLVVPRMHTHIMNARKVLQTTKTFLQQGRFS